MRNAHAGAASLYLTGDYNDKIHLVGPHLFVGNTDKAFSESGKKAAAVYIWEMEWNPKWGIVSVLDDGVCGRPPTGRKDPGGYLASRRCFVIPMHIKSREKSVGETLKRLAPDKRKGEEK